MCSKEAADAARRPRLLSCLICCLQGCLAIKVFLALLREHLLHVQRGMTKLALERQVQQGGGG